MASWAKQPQVVIQGKKPLMLYSMIEILEGLRAEYLPEMMPPPEAFVNRKIPPDFWEDSKTPERYYYTIRGWVRSLGGFRTQTTTTVPVLRMLEEAFLELYPPFGDFRPPVWAPWIPGELRSSARSAPVEYSLTSVFDSKILRSKDGWAHFHRLISRAIKIHDRPKINRAGMGRLWALPKEDKIIPNPFEQSIDISATINNYLSEQEGG